MITVDFANLHAILKSGSPLYRKYLERRSFQEKVVAEPALREDESSSTPLLLDKALRCLNVSELLDNNSAFRKFSAVQKRHLECLAEGPVHFYPGERLWRAGAPVEKAFLIVSGSASFVPKRRNAGSAGVPSLVRSYNVSSVCERHRFLTLAFYAHLVVHLFDQAKQSDGSLESEEPALGERMRLDALQAIKQLVSAAQQYTPGFVYIRPHAFLCSFSPKGQDCDY